VLNAPIDQGFNRLAWFVPYAIGLGGMLIVGFAAVRWSRHDAEPAAQEPTDPEIDHRLDDELRNLD
jgi:hypothetical protein